MIFLIDIRAGEVRLIDRYERELDALAQEENDDDYQPVSRFEAPVCARLVA